MAYIYQVSFDIGPEQMNELEIGSSLERVLSYLKALLPAEPGFITARAMSSLDLPTQTHLVFESVWDHWDDLASHHESQWAEQKILTEFRPHVELEGMATHVYQEVS